MNDLLYLCHRLPYPPNKGDKIRSYHWLTHLAKRYRIFLGTFIDDEDDWQYSSTIGQYCEEVCVRPIRRMASMRGKLRAYLSGRPLTLGHYEDKELGAWVESIIRERRICRILLFSSAMAQFIRPELRRRCGIVADLVDVDSEKWREYSLRRRWPLSSVYRKEAETLLAYEREVAASCSSTLFVSNMERELFAKLAPGLGGVAHAVPNGVDTEYFSPIHEFEDLSGTAGPSLVFTGAMDYWANVDAVIWFVREIWPQVKAAVPDSRFLIVGARPTTAVRALAGKSGVIVTGAVSDVRPYVVGASAAVAPLRVARGVQNKVLEAFALGRPVVATSAALDGIDVPNSLEGFRADGEQSFTSACVRALKSTDQEPGRAAREFVVANFQWERSVRAIEGYLERAAEYAFGQR